MIEGGKTKVASNDAPFRAVQKTAKEIGVSQGTFERAKKIIKTAQGRLKTVRLGHYDTGQRAAGNL